MSRLESMLLVALLGAAVVGCCSPTGGGISSQSGGALGTAGDSSWGTVAGTSGRAGGASVVGVAVDDGSVKTRGQPGAGGAIDAGRGAGPPSLYPGIPLSPAREATKTYDCGAKGQKPCPMQGWMKAVMSPASSSGDGARIAGALESIAGKTPPGYPDWMAVAKEGAAKAKAGDIDGAKASCKKCHDAYKNDYQTKMRDRAW